MFNLAELQAKKPTLKNVETIVRPMPMVCDGTQEFGDQWLCGERLEETVGAYCSLSVQTLRIP